jgi:hypothetical protein
MALVGNVDQVKCIRVDNGLRNDARNRDQIWQKDKRAQLITGSHNCHKKNGNERVIIHQYVYSPREASPLCKGEWVDRSG